MKKNRVRKIDMKQILKNSNDVNYLEHLPLLLRQGLTIGKCFMRLPSLSEDNRPIRVGVINTGAGRKITGRSWVGLILGFENSINTTSGCYRKVTEYFDRTANELIIPVITGKETPIGKI